MPENEEEATAVYARKVHKGASDEVNRAIFEQIRINAWRIGTVLAHPFDRKACVPCGAGRASQDQQA